MKKIIITKKSNVSINLNKLYDTRYNLKQKEIEREKMWKKKHSHIDDDAVFWTECLTISGLCGLIAMVVPLIYITFFL